ncbi:helix-turn-helix domain-containing protein [Marinobacter sp.]|uniref:helix-turn-helix domain-containing protein n=1 Tax=Marinobacter sp. TaxID=50741 RepID=UPI0035C66C1A
MQDEIDTLLSDSPNLRAKEIAKKLGLPKSQVSSYLHTQKGHRYLQNADFEWTLLRSPRKTLTLSPGWLSGDDFEDDFCQAGSLFDDSVKLVDIVCSEGCRPMIDAVAKILALANQLADKGTSVTLDFSESTNSLSYLNRAGFFDLLDRRIDVLPRFPKVSSAQTYEGNSATLAEFARVEVSQDNSKLKETLTQKFVAQTSDKYRMAAFTIFGELIENVKEHSKANLPGFAASQKYRGQRKHIKAVVSDNGIGIAETLRSALKQHHPALFKRYGEATKENDVALVIEAMSKGRISRKGREGGLGFHSSKEYAMKFNAEFTVRQNNFLLRFDFREGELANVIERKDLPYLCGTHICFDFFIGKE